MEYPDQPQQANEVEIRPDFEGVRAQLTRLDIYASQACKYNHNDWSRLRNQEDFDRVYELGDEERIAYEDIYADGRECAAWIASHFSSFNDVGRFATLKSFIDSFDNTWVYQTESVRETIARAQTLMKRNGGGPWAVRRMIKLFESELSILEAVPSVLDSIKQSPIYKQEAGIKLDSPVKTTDNEWLKNLITLIVILGFGLAGFFVLTFWQGVLWLFFVAFASPLVIAFVLRAGKISGKGLTEIYKTGLAQLTLITAHFKGENDPDQKH